MCSWKAYRYQKPKVIEFKDKDKKSNQKKESSSTNVNNVANKNKDNSNEKKDTSSMLWAKFTSESLTQNKMSDIEALLKLREETNQNINSKPKNSKNNSSNPLNNLLFSAPTVPKVENESTSSESINNTDSSVGNTINKSDNNLINEFDSNYIEFEEEPEDIKHIYDDILKKYKTEIKQCNSNIGEWEGMILFYYINLLILIFILIKGEKYESNYKDKIFYRFQKRIERNQSQCIRYSRRGEPLWIRKETPTSIPDCEICHSKRTFEMQIMPSLIYMLQSSQGVHLDYGTITVYTCSNDHCYQKALNEEYVFVQQSV